jgi:SAM-dependent methyltransferase
VDRKIGKEAYPLDYPDESADVIRASHVLEHFDWRTVPKVIADWRRVLKPGGIIKIAVPDMRWIAEHIDHPMSLAYTMGGQTDSNDFHKSAFTTESLAKLLRDSGFDAITSWKSSIEDCAALPVSLNLQGRKTAGAPVLPKSERTKIAAVMSMPRLAFSENMFCAASVLPQLDISLSTVTGAFWGQCLERGMERCVEEGAEWLLTIDYDSVFDAETLKELCFLLAEHPEADAIAPLQARREEDCALVRIEDEHGNARNKLRQSELDAPLLKVASAHFGLTLFRVESLQKLPHPWFIGQPNKEGRWEEGRVDEDIYFWNQWKAIGNTLFLAPNVRVGHLQLMVSWPNEKFQPVHQYAGEYRKKGAPKFTNRSPLAPARASADAPEFGNGGEE